MAMFEPKQHTLEEDELFLASFIMLASRSVERVRARKAVAKRAYRQEPMERNRRTMICQA
jgi:hypothetical protein